MADNFKLCPWGEFIDTIKDTPFSLECTFYYAPKVRRVYSDTDYILEKVITLKGKDTAFLSECVDNTVKIDVVLLDFYSELEFFYNNKPVYVMLRHIETNTVTIGHLVYNSLEGMWGLHEASVDNLRFLELVEKYRKSYETGGCLDTSI